MSNPFPGKVEAVELIAGYYYSLGVRDADGMRYRMTKEEAEYAAAAINEREGLLEQNRKMRAWVDDLQSQMYVNCVYCGHRYGPRDEVPASMADVLKEHIEQCPEHPMSKLKAENHTLLKQNRKMREMLGRCGWYISATMSMYDYTKASQLKRDIDALLKDE